MDEMDALHYLYMAAGSLPNRADLMNSVRARIAELEAQNAELQKDRERMDEVHAYLLGEASLDGKWFGDDLPPRTPKFWWRKPLRQAIESARGAKDS